MASLDNGLIACPDNVRILSNKFPSLMRHLITGLGQGLGIKVAGDHLLWPDGAWRRDSRNLCQVQSAKWPNGSIWQPWLREISREARENTLIRAAQFSRCPSPSSSCPNSSNRPFILSVSRELGELSSWEVKLVHPRGVVPYTESVADSHIRKRSNKT